MHFIVCVCLCSMCLAASTVAHWQVGLWHLQYINTPHNTSALCKLSPSHTSAFLSLVSIFSLTFPVSLSLIIIVVLPLFFLSKLPEFLVASVWAVAQNANGAVFASLWGDKDKRWTEKINNRLGRSEYKQINMTALSRCARGLGDVCLEGVLGEPGRRSATAA